MNGGTTVPSVDQALAETAAWLQRIAANPSSGESIVAAPMIKIPKGVILPEALLIIDVVTVTTGVEGRARITVARSRSFPTEAATPIRNSWRLPALRPESTGTHCSSRSGSGHRDEIDVAADGFLVFTWPGSNSPSIRAKRTSPIRPSAPSVASSGSRRLLSPSCARTISRPTTQRSSSACSKRRRTIARLACRSATSRRDVTPAPWSLDDPIVLGDEVKRLLGRHHCGPRDRAPKRRRSRRRARAGPPAADGWRMNSVRSIARRSSGLGRPAGPCRGTTRSTTR